MHNKYSGEYAPPTLTVDVVVFQLIDNQLATLVVKRTQPPFQSAWALPGGYDAAGETTHQAMRRILKDKAGLDMKAVGLVDQLYTFDTVARDPRGHAVSVAYLCLGYDLTCAATSEQPTFRPVANLPKLAFDHRAIIDYAKKRLASKITYTNIIAALLPDEFTLTELQRTYEAILERPLDKRNFRKKFLSLNLIHATGDSRQGGAHRPAQLYAFNSRKLEVLETQFQ